jgi:hypothetical protein
VTAALLPPKQLSEVIMILLFRIFIGVGWPTLIGEEVNWH